MTELDAQNKDFSHAYLETEWYKAALSRFSERLRAAKRQPVKKH
jgi:hypothetical protein